jgi:penicillin-binding protein 1C
MEQRLTMVRFFQRWQNLLTALALIAALLVGLRLWPHPPLSQGLPLSSAYYDRHGQLLRLTLASDDRFRLWTPLESIAPSVIEGVQLHEDQWFYYHPGFNPVSLIRGAWISYVKGGNRQGGSTITMQLARMHWRLNTRSPLGKLEQIARAVQLELFYSKRDILEAYLNYAPYGRNVESIGAASLIYFDKRADRLTLPEALTLSVLPQSPSYRLDKKTGVVGQSLTKARNGLFQRWREKYPVDDLQAALFELPLVLRQPEQMPFIAPHFVEQIAAQHYVRGNRPTIIQTTLDAGLQQLLERQINAFILRNQMRGIHNAAAMLVDSRDMSVVALAGSADYHSRAIHGQVNGTNAKRSPGSTLKPFIYALAIDQGILHPMTVLKDVPSAFGSYSPENYDRRFMGPITATQALIYSRNVPAVYVASRLNKPNLYQFLRNAGVGSMAAENHYGLSLALGGGEITMQELSRLYAMLANNGVLHELRFEQPQKMDAGIQLISRESSFITRDMLSQNPRPDDILAQHRQRLPVYWKTGTSWGFRDAWSAGIAGPYVLVVWLGNFNGKGNAAFVGGDSAAPLFFNIINSLQAQYPMAEGESRQKPESVKKVDICLSSGNLATVWCQRKGQTWFIPGKSPIAVDTVYRPVIIDERSGMVACPPYAGIPTRTEVFEFWPSDIRAVFASAGLPKRMPPDASHCRKGIRTGIGNAPKITSPLLNTTYTVRSVHQDKQRIVFTATSDSDVKYLYWFIDDIYLGKVAAGQSFAWSPLRSGEFRARVVDDRGRADSRRLKINLIN